MTKAHDAVRAAWRDPGSKFNSEAYRERQRLAALKRKDELSAAMTAAWEDGGALRTPEAAEARSAAARERANRPGERERVGRQMAEYWARRREEAK